MVRFMKVLAPVGFNQALEGRKGCRSLASSWMIHVRTWAVASGTWSAFIPAGRSGWHCLILEMGFSFVWSGSVGSKDLRYYCSSVRKMESAPGPAEDYKMPSSGRQMGMTI